MSDFDPKAFLDETSDFDPTSFLEETTREPASEVIPEEDDSGFDPRAALVGAGQGATLGFAEEITAPFVAGVGMLDDLPTLPGEGKLDKFKRLMQTYRDVAREEQTEKAEESPGSYTTGAISGSLLPSILGASALSKTGLAAPTTVAGKMATGAGIGALGGAATSIGEAEGGLSERLPEAKSGAFVGGSVGAFLPGAVAASKGAKKLIGSLGEIPVVRDVSEAAARGTKGQVLVTEEGRKQAGKELRKEASDYVQDIKALQKEVGGKIDQEIEDMTLAGKDVDLTDEFKQVLDKVKEMAESPDPEVTRGASRLKRILKKQKELVLSEDDQQKIEFFENLLAKAKADGDQASINDISSMIDDIIEGAPISLDPKEAQKFKQIMFRYSPRGEKPLAFEPAGAAKELSAITREKVVESSDAMQELNKQYGNIKKTLKRLKLREKDMPEEAVDKVTQTLSQLERESVTGDKASAIIEDTLDYLEDVSPEIVNRYKNTLSDASRRMELAQKIIKGGETFQLLGTPRAFATGAGNVVGLGVNRLMKATPEKLKNIANLAAQRGDKADLEVSRILNKIAESPSKQTALLFGLMQTPAYRKSVEEHSNTLDEEQ